MIIQETPLHIVSANNSVDVAKLLIEKGADVNQGNKICNITFDCIYDAYFYFKFLWSLTADYFKTLLFILLPEMTQLMLQSF